MKPVSILFLQAIVVLIGILTLTLLVWFPLTEGRATNLNLFEIYSDKLILYSYVSSIPFFIALFNALRLLEYTGKNKVFTVNAVKALKNIKICAIVICFLIIIAGIFIRFSHHEDDDPAGFLAICILITLVSIVVATVAAIFEKVLQNAINIKSENDLTI